MKLITATLALMPAAAVWASPIKVSKSPKITLEELDILTDMHGKEYTVSQDGIEYLSYISTPATNSDPKNLSNPGKLDSPEPDKTRPNTLNCYYEGTLVRVAGIYAHIDDVCKVMNGLEVTPKKVWRATRGLNGKNLQWEVRSNWWSFTYGLDNCIPEMRTVQHNCANYISQGKPPDERSFMGGWKVDATGNLFTEVKTKR